MLSNRNFFAMANATAPVWGFRPGMISIGVSPLFHIAGTGWNLMVMSFGGTVVLHRQVDAERSSPTSAATASPTPSSCPAILQLILARRNEGAADPSSLETVVYGASPISDRVLLELFAAFDCKFMQGYGLTETSGAVTTLRAEDHDPARPELLRSCGEPLRGVELRIVDPETGVDRADGEVGEVWIRSDQVMTGYWRNPEATAAAIDGRRLVPLGRRRLPARRTSLPARPGEGHDRLRCREHLPRRGRERADESRRCRRGRRDRRARRPLGRDGQGASSCAAAGSEVTETELIAHARANLAHYKCPTSIDFVDELPRNATGQDPEARSPRAVLGRQGSTHQLTAAARSGADARRCADASRPASRSHDRRSRIRTAGMRSAAGNGRQSPSGARNRSSTANTTAGLTPRAEWLPWTSMFSASGPTSSMHACHGAIPSLSGVDRRGRHREPRPVVLGGAVEVDCRGS